MKKINLSLFLLLMTMGTSAAVKDSFTIGDLTYTVLTENNSSGTVSVKAISTEITGDVVIPETVSNNGILYTVTQVAEKGFWKCKSMTSVKIPESVNYVGSFGFNGCEALDSLVFPNDDLTFSFCILAKDVRTLPMSGFPKI